MMVTPIFPLLARHFYETIKNEAVYFKLYPKAAAVAKTISMMMPRITTLSIMMFSIMMLSIMMLSIMMLSMMIISIMMLNITMLNNNDTKHNDAHHNNGQYDGT